MRRTSGAPKWVEKREEKKKYRVRDWGWHRSGWRLEGRFRLKVDFGVHK